MASRSTWERRIWSALAATMRSGDVEDLLPDLTRGVQEQMTDAEHARLMAAWTAVENQLDRRAGS